MASYLARLFPFPETRDLLFCASDSSIDSLRIGYPERIASEAPCPMIWDHVELLARLSAMLCLVVQLARLGNRVKTRRDVGKMTSPAVADGSIGKPRMRAAASYKSGLLDVHSRAKES